MPYKDKLQQKIAGRNWKRRKYQQERDALIAAMGGKCAKCGTDERLEVNHVDGWREYALVQPGCLNRLRRYRAEWEAWLKGEGLEVNLLCRRCNMKEMNTRCGRTGPEVAQTDTPF